MCVVSPKRDSGLPVFWNVWNLLKTIKVPERCQWRRFGVFIVNFEQILNIVLVFPFLTLNKFFENNKKFKSWHYSSVVVIDFEQI